MKRSRERLPPQPTDTALARFVQRLVDRFPGVSIGRHREMESRAKYLQLLCDRQSRDYEELAADHACPGDDQRGIHGRSTVAGPALGWSISPTRLRRSW